MSQRKQKSAKIVAKPIEHFTAQDEPIFFLIQGLWSLVPLLIVAWFFWWLVRRYRRTLPRRELSESGYILIDGRLEHRMIAERVLKRELVPGEEVHHINGVKTDNRLANLCVLDHEEHLRFHNWVNWKHDTDGYYPSKKYQRAILRYRHGGTLLITYPDDLPPFKDEPKRFGN